MRILFFMGTETNFNPGKISSIDTLVMQDGMLRKGMSEVFKVEDIVGYFEKKYNLTASDSDNFSAGKEFKDSYPKIVKEIVESDLIITFDYFEYYDIFYAKEFFLSAPYEKAPLMEMLNEKIIDLSIYKEENQDIFDFYKDFGKNLTTEIERIKNKLYMMPAEKSFMKDPNKYRVTLLVMLFCILVNHDELTLSENLEKDVKYFIDEFFGGMIF